MHHWRGYKGQSVLPQAESIIFAHHQTALRKIGAEKILHHGKSFGRSHNHRLRIMFHKIGNICRMVRLHMLHNQIIRLTVLQHCCQIIQPFMRKIAVHRIHNGNLLI